jgi:NTP pyrophosphatase (non-canonical NTP hydrolase)
MEDLIEKIKQWGHDRGITRNSSPLAQSRKTIEEVHELITACAMQYYDTGSQDTEEALADAVGDVFVTLVMVAGCAGLDIQTCVSRAYNEIKDRKGYLRPDGVFVKETT